MSKKKILIVNNNLHIGGVQKALVNLLWNIRGQYDVTLLLLFDGGECRKDLPPDIAVISAGGAYRYIGMTKDDVRTLSDKIGRGFFAAITRLFGRKYAVTLMSLGQKPLNGYDVVISYLHNSGEKVFYGGCNDFVLKHANAKKKVTFLHCDYGRCGADTEENKAQYGRFDAIAACSRGCADAFLQARPELKDRVTVVENCHRFEKIREAAEAAPVSLAEDKINIVTVARLGKEKGVERALRAIAQMGPLKERIHYYVIGDGIRMPLLREILKEKDLADTVTLCGLMKNPYGYIRQADLLLIPSYSEAAPLVIGEAAALETPVLSTETSSAREMIEQTAFGWVCENLEEAMSAALDALVADPRELDRVSRELALRHPDNSRALDGFYRCISL